MHTMSSNAMYKNRHAATAKIHCLTTWSDEIVRPIYNPKKALRADRKFKSNATFSLRPDFIKIAKSPVKEVVNTNQV